MSGEKNGKIFRGTITRWQLHHLSIPQAELDRQVDEEGGERPLPLIITGTVQEDPTGRMQAGWHMRTSLLTFLDEEAGYCETRKSVYRLAGRNGCDVLPDLGNNVLKIFY